MSGDHGARFVSEHVLAVGEHKFDCLSLDSTMPDTGTLPVLKHRDNVERYVELAVTVSPEIIVELGIAKGGSTALLNELFRPDVVLAFELDTERGPHLDTYLSTTETPHSINAFYGVNQADAPTLRSRSTEIIGDRPIDLVIDDASHMYRETRSSFETLFPLVRPGGLFIIEDWNVDQLMGDAIDRIRHDPTAPQHEAVLAADAKADPATSTPPLTQLALELILVRGSAGQAIHEVTINENWVIIERGSDPLDSSTFALDDLLHNHHFGFR